MSVQRRSAKKTNKIRHEDDLFGVSYVFSNSFWKDKNYFVLISELLESKINDSYKESLKFHKLEILKRNTFEEVDGYTEENFLKYFRENFKKEIEELDNEPSFIKKSNMYQNSFYLIYLINKTHNFP